MTSNKVTIDCSIQSVAVIVAGVSANFTVQLNNVVSNTTTAALATLRYTCTNHYLRYPTAVTAYTDNGVTPYTITSSSPYFRPGALTTTYSFLVNITFVLTPSFFSSNYILCDLNSSYSLTLPDFSYTFNSSTLSGQTVANQGSGGTYPLTITNGTGGFSSVNPFSGNGCFLGNDGKIGRAHV